MKESLSANKTVSHYRILQALGAGGMGEVYLAEDSRLDRKVALKLLPQGFTRDQERLRRFEREARLVSALNHPNILTIHEVGIADETHFIAAEFVDGQTLRELLRGVRLGLSESLEFAIQIASALSAAHEAGIVHRDLKPENVMARRDGIVKVLDFGLAKLTEGEISAEMDVESASLQKVTTEPGTVLGTPRYMSPEQARGQKLDARSDVFSLGVVLYEMLTGRPPFDGVNAIEVLTAILNREPAPLKQHWTAVPDELQRVVGKALRKNRDERYQTARDLLNDLKDLKEELAFAAKLESTGRTERNEAATFSAEAVPTAGTALRTTSSAKIIFGEVKRHKLATLIALLVLVAAATGVVWYLQAQQTAAAIDSIAVLPFANQNRAEETDYLVDGLTESIINNLTQLPNLRVIARNSVFRYKGKEDDLIGAGKALGVRAVVMGRVLQRGENLTVSAELVDVRDNKQLWGERYERQVADLLGVQREIAKEISANLRLKLSGADERRVTKHYTENTEAYQLYLKGRFYWNKRTGEALKKAIEYFNQAIEKDPSYAHAFAGMAEAYVVLPNFSVASPQDSAPKAKAAAKRALELDETLAEAHTALAYVLLNYYWDFREANREFQRAIALNPNYATAHQWYGNGYLLAIMERFDEAIAEGKRALELDPLSLIVNSDLGQDYYFARQYDQAIEQLLKNAEIDPSFYTAHANLGMAYQAKGSFQEALAEYRRARELSDDPIVLARLGYALAASGQRTGALQTLDQLKEISKQRYVPAYGFAILYAGLGEKEQAFEWLERSYQDREPKLTRLKVDPLLDPLRPDPRFADLVHRVGLQPSK
jgi:serine/threonine-protein kinase